MILILASEFDQQAHVLAKLWHGAVVTPGDLSRAGWRYELPFRDGAVAVASGKTIEGREITGVLTRLSSIGESELHGIADEDRPYVATEMHSFLVAWLDALECPVLNRPTPSCLCGPARFAGVEDGGEPVVVVGDRCFGTVAPSELETARRLAREADVDLLEVRFQDGRVSTRLIPDLSDSEAQAAVFAWLSSGKQAVRVPLAPARTNRQGSQVLLWGLPADGPLGRVHEELERMGAPVWLLDQRDVLETEVCRGKVRVHGQHFSLDDVRSVYLRCYDSTQLPHVLASRDEDQRRAAEVDASIYRWLETTGAFLVSPLDAMAVNNSKPYQLRWIAEFGWRIPETLITTDPDAVRTFWKRHGQVIYKSISGVRSRVSRLTAGHEPRMDDVTSCPTQFQEFIRGTDYRVHVVGREVFACQVLSEADDYRYDSEAGPEYVACDLPAGIEERCRVMSAGMGLPVSGIDLRLTPEGEWVCFEVNPSPGFSAFEAVTGQPIAAALARLLVDPPA